MSLRDTCLRCDGPLRKYAHWGICKACDPEFYAYAFPDTPPPLPRPQLMDVGNPTIGGKR